MAKQAKNTMATLTAKAAAKVLEQGAKDWGMGEHAACLRYLTLEVLKECKATDELVKEVSAKLAETFKADPELTYASNFKKLLVEAGDLDAGVKGGQYE